MVLLIAWLTIVCAAPSCLAAPVVKKGVSSTDNVSRHSNVDQPSLLQSRQVWESLNTHPKAVEGGPANTLNHQEDQVVQEDGKKQLNPARAQKRLDDFRRYHSWTPEQRWNKNQQIIRRRKERNQEKKDATALGLSYQEYKEMLSPPMTLDDKVKIQKERRAKKLSYMRRYSGQRRLEASTSKALLDLASSGQ